MKYLSLVIISAFTIIGVSGCDNTEKTLANKEEDCVSGGTNIANVGKKVCGAKQETFDPSKVRQISK